jgi:hypothetical protein
MQALFGQLLRHKDDKVVRYSCPEMDFWRVALVVWAGATACAILPA